jgi:cytochrome c
MSSNSGMEINKIAAAVLLAGLIGMVASKVTDFLYDDGSAHHGSATHEVARGYSIEVPENLGAGTAHAAAPKGAPDLSALFASASVEKGAAYFAKKCAVCHTPKKGAGNKVGPNLWNVIGRDIASVSGFNYSSALQAKSGEKWTADAMNGFQYSPRKWARGTIMSFAGIKKDKDRADLIAYLNSLSDSPKPLPSAQ